MEEEMLPNWIKMMLSENNLNEYVDVFENNKLDTVEKLIELNENDLVNMGINIIGDRKVLLNIFKEKQNNTKTNIDNHNKQNKKNMSFLKKIMRTIILSTIIFLAGLLIIISIGYYGDRDIDREQLFLIIFIIILISILFFIFIFYIFFVNDTSNTDTKKYPLITLTNKLFYPFLEIFLWLNLFCFTILGGFIGYNNFGFNTEYGFTYLPTFGLIIGFIIGITIALIINIIIGGLVSIFLKLCSNMEKIKNKLEYN